MQEKRTYMYTSLDNSPIAMSKCTDIQYTEYCDACHGLCNRFARRH
jgi:hypothetical protein